MPRFHFLSILCIISCTASKPDLVKEHSKMVYHIPPDESQDDPTFKLCDAPSAYPYYGTETAVPLDKRALLEYFLTPFNHARKTTPHSGYITIRFMVNCHGQSGRFRILAFDMDYQAKKFPAELRKSLLDLTRDLPKWKVTPHKNRTYDTYSYFTFKIDNGLLTDVLP